MSKNKSKNSEKLYKLEPQTALSPTYIYSYMTKVHSAFAGSFSTSAPRHSNHHSIKQGVLTVARVGDSQHSPLPSLRTSSGAATAGPVCKQESVRVSHDNLK